MRTFSMNSLLGQGNDDSDIVSDNDTWVELDTVTYQDFYKEVKADNCIHLFELMRISDQFAFDANNVRLHFIEYDVPVLVLEDQNSINTYFAGNIINTPGLILDGSRLNGAAACLRCRLSSKQKNLVCLFPFILMPYAPPTNLAESPLLAHEILHLKKTFTHLYNERSIKYTFWNKDLQSLVKSDLHGALSHKIMCPEQNLS